MSADRDADLEADLALLTDRLVRRYEGQLDPELVERTVRRHADDYANARIGDFVPVLIERHSVADLAAAVEPRESTGTNPGLTLYGAYYDTPPVPAHLRGDALGLLGVVKEEQDGGLAGSTFRARAPTTYTRDALYT